MLLRLAYANLLSRKARMVLTVLAIALSVALVVAMTSGFKAFETAASEYLDRFMGAVDATITRGNDPSAAVGAEIVQQLREDPRVKSVFARLSTDLPLPMDLTSGAMPPRAMVVGVTREDDPLLGWVTLNEGRWFAKGERACVIDQPLADQLKLKLGQTMKLPGRDGVIELPVVGILHISGAFALLTPSKAYVPLEVAQTFVFGQGAAPRVSNVFIQFHPGVKQSQFMHDWTDRLAQTDPLLKLKLTRTKRDELDRNFMGLKLLSALAASVTMVAAMFVIFSTLSMGVTERQRTLAMMRAIGMVRLQVAKLVLMEAVFIGAISLLAGVPLGLALEAIVARMLRPLVTLSPSLDWFGVALATATAMGAAIVASLLPAWQATRVSPLEAMTPLAAPSSERFPIIPMLVGLLLISFDPTILFFPVDSDFAHTVQFFLHFIVGLPGVMIGFFLLAPAFVWVLNRLAIPILALVLRVPGAVMRQQVAGGLWRSAGTCTSLMVGLAVLVVMQTQGNSSLNSWTLPTHFPDVFIFTRSLSGLSPAAQEKVRASPYLKSEDVMPIGTTAPEVGGGLLGLVGTRFPGNTMFIAIQPDRGFRLMELDFRQGNVNDAKDMLLKGRHIVVTEEFARMRKVGVGDKVTFKRRMGKEPVEYTIAGVVWSPGIDVMINAFDLSQQVESQSAACVFGTIEDAQRDFDLSNVWLMCANFKELGVPRETLADELQKSLGDSGVNVADVRKLKHTIQTGLSHLLYVASSIAWGALLIASLGVTNTIIASIRSRMYQFGVLRSIGLTRWTLVRLVLAEATLLGIIGAVMGVTCGATMTVDARQLIAISIGHRVPVLVPWDIIWLGVAVVVGVSLLASVLPAIRVARTSPLSLLQAGRAAA